MPRGTSGSRAASVPIGPTLGAPAGSHHAGAEEGEGGGEDPAGDVTEVTRLGQQLSGGDAPSPPGSKMGSLLQKVLPQAVAAAGDMDAAESVSGEHWCLRCLCWGAA